MPTRLIREGILTSEKVNRLDASEEVFYRRLMSVVDDYGRCEAHTALLRASMYPLKLDRVKEATAQRLLASVESAGLVRIYAVGPKKYLEILNFRQQTRSASRHPAPPGLDVDDPKHCPTLAQQCLADDKQRSAAVHLGGVGDGDEGGGASGGEGGERRGALKGKGHSLLPSQRPEPDRSRMLSINRLMDRKAATRWSTKELKAFQEGELGGLPEADWIDQFGPLEAYYAAPVEELREYQGTRGNEDYRRRALLTLLNDWGGQVDKARMWKHLQSKKYAARDAGRLEVHSAPNKEAV